MAPRLKSLELHGYKTFASRTVFEFPGVITAIVGPNGSGKSNVSDAMRWVLGEQSYSLLRGRKTEDMIFAGSEQRPRAGMASASIVFNNEDGWLPIDFSEVAITRRAYRDGNNEYLLNGQRVRLKEISELLAQSGLAERTYTIIGQGLVDAALSLKPEERRRFFEEAAGIGLYRSRREESLNRLDATRRNLERVQDILSELEPRLSSLERQARRVQEYERIKAELRILLREWFGYHWHKSQQDLSHILEVLRSQEGRLDQARQKQQDIDEQMTGLRERLQENRGHLNTWHGQSAELHTRREGISRKLAVLDERNRALIAQQRSLESDLSRLEEELESRSQRLQDLQQERNVLKSDLEDAEAQAVEALGNLNKRQSERAQAEKDLRETRRLLVQNETRQVQLKARRDELANRREEQQKTITSLSKSVESGEATLQAARTKQAEAAARRDEADNTRKEIEARQQAHQQRLHELDQERRKLQESRSKLDGERVRQRAQLEVLEQAERSLSGLNSGAKFVLQAAGQGKLPGKYRAVSSQLEVPQEFEAAIAACLGDLLDGILLEPGTDPEHVLEILEKGDKGRAVLFPLDSTRTGDITDPVINDPDCLGVAAGLVRAPEALSPLIRLLLGQVLVVRSRAAARRIVSQLSGSGRVVTLRGEVFWGSGMITAGQEARAGIIARPRQKRELQELLAALDEQIKHSQDQQQKLETELNAHQEAGRELDKQLRQAGQAYSQAAQQNQQALLELEQNRQKNEFQQGQLTNLEGQIKRTNDEIGQVQGELARVEKSITGLQEQVREGVRMLSGLPLEELQAQVVHWNTQTAVVTRALKDAENRLVEYRQALEANHRQQDSLRQRQADAAQTLRELEAEKEQARTAEVQLNQEIETLQAQIDPAEADLQVMEKEYARLQGDQAAAQQGVAVAERYVTQSQLELSRQRESIASLRRRIEEDFGLVSFEVSGDASQTPLPLDGMVEELPVVKELSGEVEDSINRQRAQLRRLGAVNFEAQSEYLAVKERYDFLTNQVADLKKADADLRQVINELDELMKREFRKTFDAVAVEFKAMFTRLFGGGTAHLILTDEDHPTETGIDIEARLPGRREQGLTLLSGGERSLTAVALVFSLLKVSPTPFCILDEVDAMLDEANVGRYRDLLKELSANTQFLVITHNRNTVQAADVIYGITMGRDSASQMISLRLDEISEDMAK